MKISYNWLKEYINIDMDVDEVAQLLTDSGLEVDGIEEIETVKGGLKGFVIGEVKTCEQHPNADKLSKTTVDIGSGDFLPIVCGAPNVAAGQKVVVATVGTTLYNGDNSFKIKKAKLRGEASEGMICAEDELGLGESHEGIMVLDENAEIGQKASEYFNIESDTIIEIDLTPNRSDATSHIGTARDLAAMINSHKNENLKLKKPNVDSFKVDSTNLNFSIEIEKPEACNRYTSVAMSNIEVKESPDWLKNKLRAIGLNPINNIVDISNFVLHETGHPLHIFDYDKIADKKVIIKTLKKGSKFKALDENEYKLHENDLMICDADHPMCIAGVFGGIDSGVKSETKNIFIESAYFNPTYVRKTSKRHLLNTDASFRFERGADPNNTVYALKRAALLIKEIAGGEIASEIEDVYPNKIDDYKVELSLKRLQQIAGQSIPNKKVISILNDLEIKIISENNEILSLEVPTFKADVQREIDVIEEILRIYGYNNIKIDNKLKSSISHMPEVDNYELKNNISNFLVSKSWVEAWNNSLSKMNYYEDSPDFNEDKTVKILNPLSSELNIMRMDMVFGLLENVKRNHNFKTEDIKLFEFGGEYIHSGEPDKDVTKEYIQNNKLALMISGKSKPENWRDESKANDFFDIKQIVLAILSKLGIPSSRIQAKEIKSGVFAYGLDLELKGQRQSIATFGKLKAYYTDLFEIEKDIYYANINWDVVFNTVNPKTKYTEISKFPVVKRDFALLLDDEIPYSEIERLAFKTEKKLLKSVNLFDNYKGKGIPEGKKSYAVSFILGDDQKTLKDKIIDKTMNRLKSAFERELGAELR